MSWFHFHSANKQCARRTWLWGLHYGDIRNFLPYRILVSISWIDPGHAVRHRHLYLVKKRKVREALRRRGGWEKEKDERNDTTSCNGGYLRISVLVGILGTPISDTLISQPFNTGGGKRSAQNARGVGFYALQHLLRVDPVARYSDGGNDRMLPGV